MSTESDRGKFFGTRGTLTSLLDWIFKDPEYLASMNAGEVALVIRGDARIQPFRFGAYFVPLDEVRRSMLDASPKTEREVESPEAVSNGVCSHFVEEQ